MGRFWTEMSVATALPPYLDPRLLPGSGAGAAHEDVECFATGVTERGKLSQVEAVGQAHRPPPAPKEGGEALGGALSGAIRVEDSIDGQRVVECRQPFEWKVGATDREHWQLPTDRGEPVKWALNQVRGPPAGPMVESQNGFLSRQ